MSNEKNETKSEGGSRGGAMLVVAVVVGLLVGGGGGAFIVAPLVGTKAVSPAHAQTAAEYGEGEEGEYEAPCSPAADSQSVAPKTLHTVENLVLNPARSGGTRFLMASVAIGLRDEAAATQLKERDAEVRDILLSVLGSKSVTELAEVSARDSLRTELRAGLGSIVRPQSIQQVYFPQFVIQ